MSRRSLIKVVEERASATKPTFNIDPRNLTKNTLAQSQKSQDELGFFPFPGWLVKCGSNIPSLKANQNFLQLQAQA
jgi:hypothetical protein